MVISTTWTSSSLICSSVSFIVLFIPPPVFFISVIVFFISGSPLYFPTLLKNSDFLFCVFSGLLSYLIISIIIASLVAQTVKCLPAMWETWVPSLGGEDHYLTLFWVGCLSSLSSSGVYFVPLFGTYSAVTLFCPVCCCYVSDKLGTVPILEKSPFVGDIMCPSPALPVVTRAVCSRRHLCGLCASFFGVEQTAFGGLVGTTGPWPGWWGCVMRHLAVGSWRSCS